MYIECSNGTKIYKHDGEYRTEYLYGCTEWRNINGELHRKNGPAVKWVDGNKEYYQHGKLHRADGPAFIWGKSYSYHRNGELHRKDGPAVFRSEKRTIGISQATEYWLNGKQLTKEQWKDKCRK